MSTPSAVVTGATAGIGAAFARRLARDGYGLVLVARRVERLEESAAQLRDAGAVWVEVLPADLATTSGQEAVAARLADPKRAVDLLINNAGLSLNTPFLRSTPEAETTLLQVNVCAVMRLTLAVLPGMVERRRGAIINVSSVAGFGPTMPGSTYPATKAWVTNFTESVAQSVAPFGVRLMALCPGYVRTELHQRAGIDMSVIPNWLWLDADWLVDKAMRDLQRGLVVSVPSVRYKVATLALRHLPRAVVRRVTKDMRGRIGRDPSEV